MFRKGVRKVIIGKVLENHTGTTLATTVRRALRSMCWKFRIYRITFTDLVRCLAEDEHHDLNHLKIWKTTAVFSKSC